MSLTSTIILAGALAAGRPPHFESEVLPVLTKAGCNAGSCHGAAAGRGGFHLSLWGSDPAADYQEIVREFEGRRVDLARPEESLILRKPTGQAGHEGGIPLPHDSAGADRLTRWIAAGVPRGDNRELKEFTVIPSLDVLSLKEAVVLRSEARFADQPLLDVTEWTVWKPADPSAVTIDPKTTSVQVHRPGQHVIIARFLNRVVPVQLLVPYGKEPVEIAASADENFVDKAIHQRLRDLRLPLSPPATAAEFVRRVHLDLTGRLPTPDLVEAYLKSESKNPESIREQRAKLIDRLLASEEFVEYWTYQLAELLRVGGNKGGLERAQIFHGWLRRQLEEERPYDEIAWALITANGDPQSSGPPNFYLVAGDARGQAEYVSQAFLGVRLRCANCHNHPLDKWTQDDYHGFAAVFARVNRGKEIGFKPSGNVIHPKTGEPAEPRIPGSRFLAAEGDLREPVAEWMTSPDNGYFAKSLVNRLWKSLMGRGLVDPTDDLSETNPATHPELLEQLADDFKQHGFRIRHTLRRIANSQAYQRQSKATPDNRLDDRFYSRQKVRPLSAEVLMDAWCDVTGVRETFAETDSPQRAIELVSPQIPSRSLDVLGRCDRSGECESTSPAGTAGGLAAQLHVLNGDVLNGKLRSRTGRLATLVSDKKTNKEILQQFYLRALCRYPTAAEREYWLDQFSKADENEARRSVLEDFVWSLLTSQEFRTNH